MPIYAYRCQDCGFEKDQLQKLSDPPLTQCPSCNQQGFGRVLTAPAFQLKGSGWYVTDFRDQGKGAKGKPAADDGGATAPTDKGAAPAGAGEQGASAKPANGGGGGAPAAPTAASSSSGAAASTSSGSGSGTPAPA